MKIVSLVPSITELLADLGLDNEVQGITKFCIHPTHFRKTKIIVGGTKNLHLDRIRSIAPDLVIANKEENTKEQVEALQAEFRVYLTDINNFDDALSMIRETGKLTMRERDAESLIDAIRKEFGILAGKRTARACCKVAYLIWKDPLMAAGGHTYINDMLQHSGLQNVFASTDRYPRISVDDLKNAELDTLLLSSEPYPFAERDIEEFSKDLPGIRIKLVDGEMFSWYGSRMLKAAKYFQELIAEL
ncbi:MAG TPA: helical backbone metal receptor [Flavitalea sp.]|nr:helical backbone metal receptor [Flavitalea sp.]